MSKWCGYIDMLGTRALAENSSQDLLEGLDKFHTALEDSYSFFTGGKCYAFSDGAFFVVERFESFVNFIKIVRNQLFQSGLYFRCSLIRGDINVISRTSPSIRLSDQEQQHFFSLTFTKDAPRAYQKESEFKGIGVYIADRVEDSEKVYSVDSFYLINKGNKYEPRRYTDLKYSIFELSQKDVDDIHPTRGDQNRILDKLIYSCHATLAQSETVSSYYLPAIVAMMRSSDFSMIEFDDKKGFSNAPYIFRELMSDSLIKTVRDLPGIHLLLLACFDYLFTSKSGGIEHTLESRVVSKLMKVPGCFKNLDRIPNFVIGAKAKQRLIEAKISTIRKAR